MKKEEENKIIIEKLDVLWLENGMGKFSEHYNKTLIKGLHLLLEELKKNSILVPVVPTDCCVNEIKDGKHYKMSGPFKFVDKKEICKFYIDVEGKKSYVEPISYNIGGLYSRIGDLASIDMIEVEKTVNIIMFKDKSRVAYLPCYKIQLKKVI